MISDNIINIEDEIRQSYMDYAMSVIVGRALPDVRDGLKPVQRRILYAMLGEGLVHNRKTSKCAGVVGEVLKRLHPHGDLPVYDALVNLAQDWSKRAPLIDGQGNFGSIDGDSPAAYRYTECRMTALAELLLQDIDKDTVEFGPNFDDSSSEPLVLPAAWPNLLVNGADGIAVGMATHIPPHNLSEVIDGAIAVIENPEIAVDELMKHIPGPDFPTGGIIHGRGPIVSAYSTGRGIVHIRAKTRIETIKNKTREAEAIIVDEIPYQVNKARLVEKIATLVNEKTIEGVSRLRDESDRDGMRIVIELKRDATNEVVLSQLYKHTQMQSSFGIINLAIVDGQPVVCTLNQLLVNFVNHRRDVVIRRSQFELRKAEERMHILEGFRIALLNLDEVIKLIKSSETPKEAKSGLCQKYELSDIQAQAILDLRLQKLTGMERLAIEKEFEELAAEIARLKGILADQAKIDAIIVSELSNIKEQYGNPRRTEIIDDGGDIVIEDLIEDDEMVVSVSHKGYIKRTAVTEYREQRRGGKGVYGAATRDDDFIEHLFVATARTDLLVFTTRGRLYWLKVYAAPEASRTARGRALVNILNLQDKDEEVTAILPVRKFEEGRFIVMATSQGYVKKTDLMAFSRMRSAGLIACTLNDDDSLIGVGISSGSDDIILATKDGRAARFSEEDVRPMGRSARGVRGVRLTDDNTAVGMVIVGKPLEQEDSEEGTMENESRVPPEGSLLSICENGYGKRTLCSEYPRKGRGGKGVIDIKTSGRNGPVIGICGVTEESGVMVITSSGKIVRMAARDISQVGRNTMGVRVVGLDTDERVQALAKLREESEDEEVGNPEGEED